MESLSDIEAQREYYQKQADERVRSGSGPFGRKGWNEQDYNWALDFSMKSAGKKIIATILGMAFWDGIAFGVGLEVMVAVGEKGGEATYGAVEEIKEAGKNANQGFWNYVIEGSVFGDWF